MDGVLARLYQRTGHWYAAFYVVFLAVWASFLTVSVILVVVYAYLDVPTFFWRILAVAFAGIWTGIIAALLIVVRRSGPLWAWMGGARDEELASKAWRVAIEMPDRLIRIAPPLVFLGVIPVMLSLARIGGADAVSLVGFAVGNMCVIVLGALVAQVVLDTMSRPVLWSIDELYPQRGETKDSVSARTRIVVSSLFVVITSALFTAGLTTRTEQPSARLGQTVLAALVIGILFASVLTFALSQSLFGPISALVDATRRVASGDLRARVPVIGNDEIGVLTRSFNEMVRGLAEREALRSALGTYVDPGIADRLLAEGEVLHGEEVDVTIMFVDIIGFSARAEMMPSEQVCAELNEFFGLVVPVVQECGGHTNKLIGDGLMAVFGTPIKLDDHADRAVHAACRIQERLDERYRGSLRAGVGLHSGPVVVGTMGGGSKLDFTLIGDAVNVAARVEALTRQTGDTILITEATKDLLQRQDIVLSSRGTEFVRGRSEPVSLYAVASRIPA